MEDWEQWRRPGPGGLCDRQDVTMTLAVMAGAVTITVLVNSMGAFIQGTAPSLGEQLAWAVVLAAPLLFRRRFPATVFVIISVVFIAGQVRQIGDNLAPSIALFLAMYSLGAWGPNRAVARWVRIAVIVAMFGYIGLNMYRALGAPDPDAFDDAAGPLDPVLATALYGIGVNVLFFGAAYVFGNQSWESARRRYELVVQGEQLRRSQADNARQAVVAERVRIARDLHDVVAHHVSVMGVQAAAARRVLDSDPAVASEALSAVETTARTAIDELRGLLGVLRADDERSGSADGSHASTPGLDQISRLAEEARVTGLRVTYAEFGEPRPVPDAVALSAYRVVQEALTNTVKHAGAGMAEIRIRHLRQGLEVEINDDGHGGAGTPHGTGLGLVGMRERVAVHGGDLIVGPRRDGGFQVRARFPLAEPVAA
ncbi:sensor histidine kinase [Luedemannella helvata]|uniref:sensor histidine kinase n=1 Tax=Luedemannella helvata TaxID=349315 RepID=UPI003CD0B35A